MDDPVGPFRPRDQAEQARLRAELARIYELGKADEARRAERRERLKREHGPILIAWRRQRFRRTSRANPPGE